MNALYLIGFVQSIFFTVLILTKRKIQLKDYILSFYILMLGLNLIFIYWVQTGFYDNNPLVVILDFAYWTLLGPLLYLYIDIVTSKELSLKWKHLIHLVPFAFILVAFSDYFMSDYKINFFNYSSNSPLFIAGYIVWMYNSLVYYIILILKLRSHRKRIKRYYSTPKDVDLKWLNYLVHGFAVFLFFLLFRGYIFRLLDLDINLNSHHFTWLVMVIYIFGIGFFGYKQKGIFSDIEFNKEESTGKEVLRTEQYAKSGLRQDEAALILEQLENKMKNDKPYLEYDITLPKLASIINTTSHKLSQVINENYDLNFFEYINKFRVKDVKKLLENPNKTDEKIMALAYECGFNSKSAFYNFFKKETSLTPSEYRNKHLSLVKI